VNIYLLTQYEVGGYDTFDSCVVCAKDEEEARGIHPEESWDHIKTEADKRSRWANNYGTWAKSPKSVTATLIGSAVNGSERGVILASFNAG